MDMLKPDALYSKARRGADVKKRHLNTTCTMRCAAAGLIGLYSGQFFVIVEPAMALRAVVVCGLGLLLAACGQKGPLYLPDSPPAKPVPTVPNTPQNRAAGASS